MQRYENNVLASNGECVQITPYADVYVYETGTVTLAAIYQTNEKAPLVNPFQSDYLGNFFFYAEDGRYDIRVVAAGRPEQWQRDVLLEDIDATGAVTQDEIAVKDGFIDEPAAASPIPSVGQPNGLGSLNAQAKAISANLNLTNKRIDDLAINDDAAEGAGVVGFGMSTDYPAGTIGWKTHRSQSRNIHKNFATDYSGNSIVVRNGESDGYHRHFGGIAEGLDGRLHLAYRRAAQHGLASEATVYYCNGDDGGVQWGAEVAAVDGEAGYDHRGVSMCVTPTGRLVCIHDKVKVPSGAPTTFHVLYSDDNGATAPLVSAGQIASVPYAYARSYGRIKLIPGKDGKPYRLAWTPYYQSGSEPSTFRAALWLSDAESDGLQWVESTPIVDDTAGYSECEMVAINADIWFAVVRGAAGLTLFKTVDGGATWQLVGVVPSTTSDSQVAPSLDKFVYDGEWYLLLGYCDRATDTMNWRIADVETALTSAAAFGGVIQSSADMGNASGYQVPITKPDGNVYIEGGMAFVEFREYVGETYSQVRFARIDLVDLARTFPRVVAASSGSLEIPVSKLEPIVQVDTEGGGSTSTVTTLSGGFEGQIVTLQGPQTTSARDVILQTDTGNLRLQRDFRFNTTISRITVQKVGANWIELGRTYDDISPAALIIASGAVTVPAADGFQYVLLASEGGAATDTLTTINGGREGQMVLLMTASSSMDITVEPTTGNLIMPASVTLLTSDDSVMLIKRGAQWKKFPTL